MPTAQIPDEITLSRRAVRRLRREIAGVDRTVRSAYVRAFEKEFREVDRPSTFDDLVIACYQADLVYAGDFHALPRSQEFIAKLLDEIGTRSRRTVLAVEMVYGRHQEILDLWMAREIDDEEFLKRIRYEQEWGYDWTAFRTVFDVARRHGIPVFGIDSAPRNGLRHIRERDRHMASRIADIYKDRPGAKIVVMVGESHLATSHLPSATRKEMARRNMERRAVRVLQNLEEPFWELAARGQEQVDTALVGRNVYCVFRASPLEKYEAYRQTIQRWNRERPDDDEIDLTPSIYSMVDTILKFLGINKYRRMVERDGSGPTYLVDVYPEVYSSVESWGFTKLLRTQRIPRSEIAEIAQHMRRNGSCYVSSVNAIYIGAFNLVHGGEEAAHFVNSALRGDLNRPDDRDRMQADLFYGAVMSEALGFFGSKIIDPTRNHFFETSFYRYYRKSREVVERETGYRYEEFRWIIDFILLHKKFERTYHDYDDVPPDLMKGIRTRKRRLFSTLTHELGYFLGQQIYDGAREGLLTRREVVKLFQRRFDDQGEALLTYLDLTERLPGGVVGGE